MVEEEKLDYSYQTKITNPELYKNGLTPYPVVETLDAWLTDEVSKVKNRSVRWLSETYFHRQEMRATYIDNSTFFTPADGVIMSAYEKVNAQDNLIEVKGCNFTLQELLQDEDLQGDFLVVSVFMTFYSQHLNHIPFSGMRTWSELPPLSTYNKPMLAVEKELLKGVINPAFQEEYLRKNGRKISTIFSPIINQEYKVVQIGDYDVDTIIEFHQNNGEKSQYFIQNSCFGKIQYGSQCVLAIPLYEGGTKFKLRPEAKVGNVVKCKRTPLATVCWGQSYLPGEVERIED